MKTHCSFCGMQCGIQLKVRDEQVVGFEPWEEFPFNHGMLCPKGVKRYLQGAHPDRLLTSLVRTDSGFAPISYDDALDLAARRLTEIKDEIRPRRGRHLRRRLDDHREGVRAREVRPRRARHEEHRLQRTALHGLGRHRVQADVRHRSRHQPVDRPGRRRCRHDRRIEHRGVCADHDALSVAVPRARRTADRGRSAHDADHSQCGSLSCRCDPAPTSRCSSACFT